METIRQWLKISYNLVFVAAAMVWRRCLTRTRVIAITGSVGKTTAKNCLVAILASRYPVVGTKGNNNGRTGIPQTLLQARRWHKYLVVEIGILRTRRMWRSALLVWPQDVVVTCVDRQHTRALKDLDTIATEKAKLLRPLGKTGLAVLNGDDTRVAAMSSKGPFRVCYFGHSPSADVWADEITAAWPNRLEFTVHAGAESQRVRTRFVGTHWTQCVLAAIAMGTRHGVSLAEAAAAVEQVEPYRLRLEPTELPSGAIMIRDEYNGGANTHDAAFSVLRDATADRKIAVIGEISDSPSTREETNRYVGEQVAGIFDLGIFVGRRGEETWRAALDAGMAEEAALHFRDFSEAAGYLRERSRRGDLILLKGEWYEHFSRMYFLQLGTVGCRLDKCLRIHPCDDCPKLGFQPTPAFGGDTGAVNRCR